MREGMGKRRGEGGREGGMREGRGMSGPQFTFLAMPLEITSFIQCFIVFFTNVEHRLAATALMA